MPSNILGALQSVADRFLQEPLLEPLALCQAWDVHDRGANRTDQRGMS